MPHPACKLHKLLLEGSHRSSGCPAQRLRRYGSMRPRPQRACGGGWACLLPLREAARAQAAQAPLERAARRHRRTVGPNMADGGRGVPCLGHCRGAVRAECVALPAAGTMCSSHAVVDIGLYHFPSLTPFPSVSVPPPPPNTHTHNGSHSHLSGAEHRAACAALTHRGAAVQCCAARRRVTGRRGARLTTASISPGWLISITSASNLASVATSDVARALAASAAASWAAFS